MGTRTFWPSSSTAARLSRSGSAVTVASARRRNRFVQPASRRQLNHPRAGHGTGNMDLDAFRLRGGIFSRRRDGLASCRIGCFLGGGGGVAESDHLRAAGPGLPPEAAAQHRGEDAQQGSSLHPCPGPQPRRASALLSLPGGTRGVSSHGVKLPPPLRAASGGDGISCPDRDRAAWRRNLQLQQPRRVAWSPARIRRIRPDPRHLPHPGQPSASPPGVHGQP